MAAHACAICFTYRVSSFGCLLQGARSWEANDLNHFGLTGKRRLFFSSHRMSMDSQTLEPEPDPELERELKLELELELEPEL